MEPTQESVPDDGAGAARPAMPAPDALSATLPDALREPLPGSLHDSVPASLPESLPGSLTNTSPESAPRTRQKLPPKGSCWYCEKPLDNVKRFCDKECANAFDEEKEFTR